MEDGGGQNGGGGEAHREGWEERENKRYGREEKIVGEKRGECRAYTVEGVSVVVVVVCQGAYTLEKGGGSLASDT